jgi:predicted Zn-dependent protease/TolB-like protein
MRTTASNLPGRRPLVLLGGLIAIVLWQLVFFRHGYPRTTLESPYRLTASGGVLQWQSEFVYFLYYLNLYPVASISDSPREYSVEGAQRLIAEQGRSLVMDRYWTLRYGELAKTYLYLPHVWLKGRPVRPRMLHANSAAFTLALLALFAAFWYADESVLGALLVLLIGSNPFQVHSVYAEDNLFGWPITLTVLMLALHVPFMRDRPPRLAAAVAVALVSGVLLGSVRQIRTEPALVIVSVVGVYLTARGLRIWLRFVLVLLLGAAFVWTSARWGNYFEGKYREAYRVVKAAGGHPYYGPRQLHHFFWHVLWCGLGDFDDKYGYVWSDVGAFSYAWPVMQRRQFAADGFPPVRPDPADILTLGVFLDKGRQYARTPFETPEYIALVRDKVLGDILHDPWWFASIIGRRLGRLLSEGTPPSLALGNGLWVPIVPLAPGAVWGCLTVVLAACLMVKSDWFRVKLLAFTVPLAATALFTYSGRGTVFYSIAHLVAVAILGAGAWERWVVRRVGFASLVHDLTPSLRVPPAAWLWFPGFGLAGLLALLSLGTVARRAVTSGRAEPPQNDGPLVAIMPFENQTSDQSLAWVGDAMGELLAATVASPGVRVLDAEAVAWLAPDRVRWGLDNVLAGPRLMALNIAADRSGAQRIVTGRVYRGQKGLVACVAVLTPPIRAWTGQEQCDHVDLTRLFETTARLARSIVPVFGGASAARPSPEALRLYEEAQGAIRRQAWGESIRLLDQSLREDPRLLPARLLRERVSSRSGRLTPDVRQDMTSAANLREGVEAFRTEVARNPHSSEARVALGRMLVDLGLLDEAVKVLNPILRTPGVPAEAFGLLATALSSRGDPGRGYQALLEYRRRDWLEPAGLSLIAAHLLRWGYLEEATQCLDLAQVQRNNRGMSALTLDDLRLRWSVRALQSDWAAAWHLATQMIDVDDPRAVGAGMLHLARGYLSQGRSRWGGALAAAAAFHLSQQHLDSGEAVSAALEARLERDDAAGALALIREMRPAESSQVDRRLAFWETVALARLGRWTEADRARKRLAKDLSDMPGLVGPPLLYHLDGELSLLRGDVSGALSSLSEAAKLLPASDFCGDRVPVWYALARSNLAARRPGQAEVWLQRITDASYERLCWPIPYALSYSLLGRIRAGAGRHDEAAEAFERFLQLWGEGDLATTERDEARRFLLARTESELGSS